MSLASIHYLRSHYQEAIDIYKRILLDNRYPNHYEFYFILPLILLTYYCHEPTNHLLNEEIIAVGTLTAVISVLSAAPVSQRSGFRLSI